MEVLCSMWNGTPMQLCSLYLCFMKKHHTFVSERPGHGEFGKKSKRNKVLKSELGGLLPNATGNNDGLMSINDKKRMGRRFTKGFKKLVESEVWYNHYVAFIFGASPASEEGVLLAVEWRGRNNINVTRIVGSSSKVKLYLGSNPETDTYELWIGFVGTDGQGAEFIIQSIENIDLYGETVETLPSYLSEVPIS